MWTSIAMKTMPTTKLMNCQCSSCPRRGTKARCQTRRRDQNGQPSCKGQGLQGELRGAAKIARADRSRRAQQADDLKANLDAAARAVVARVGGRCSAKTSTKKFFSTYAFRTPKRHRRTQDERSSGAKDRESEELAPAGAHARDPTREHARDPTLEHPTREHTELATINSVNAVISSA